MNRNELLAEREHLLDMYIKANKEERLRIVAKLAVLDEELSEYREIRKQVI